MQTLFERLNGPAPEQDPSVPDALGAQVLARATQTLFAPPAGGGAAAAAQALQGLAENSTASLLERITAALAGTSPRPDPMLDLAAHLAAGPGGPQRLTRLLGEAGTAPQRQESLMAGLMAWSGHQQLVSQGVQADDPRLQLIRKGAEHARQLLGQPGSPLPEDSLSQRDSRIAYQSLRKGLVDQTEGSVFQRTNRWLDKMSDEWLQHTARRNERAASGLPGSITNAVTALTPGGPDGKTMPLRKSSVMAATRAAVQAGLLPSDKDAVTALDASAARLRGRFAAPAGHRRPGGDPTPAQSLELLIVGVMDKLDLGTGRSPGHSTIGALGSPLDKLGKTLFKEVAATLPPGAMAGLGPAFAAEWQQLSTSHPNAGHLLGFLAEQLRHHEMGLPAGEAAGPSHRLSLQERVGHADVLASSARQALQSAAQAAGPGASAHTPAADGTAAALVSAIQASLDSATPPSNLHALDARHLDGVAAQIHAALRALPGDTGAADRPLQAALKEAAGAVQALARQADLDGLDARVADLVAVRGDLRTPRDLAAMMEATVRRMGPDTRFQMQDQRDTGLSATKLLKHLPFVNIVAEGFKQMHRSLSINMGSHGMELVIGQTDKNSATGGVNLRASIPGLDTVLDSIPGLEAQLQIGSQHGYTGSKGEGVSLRLQGFDGDTQAHRLAFGALLSDLAQARLLAGPGKPYPDVLSALLDRHPALSVSASASQDTSHTGQTQMSAALGVDLGPIAGLLGKLPMPHVNLPGVNLKMPKIPRPHIDLPQINLPHVHLPLMPKMPGLPHLPGLPDIDLPDLLFPSLHVPAIHLPQVHLPGINLPDMPVLPLPELEPSNMWYAGVGGSLGSRAQRASGLHQESGGTLQVNEYKLTARRDVEAAGHLLHLERGRGLHAAGGSHTLRLVSNEGSLLADKTQSIQRFNNPKEFRQAVEANPEIWLAMLVAQDTHSGRNDAEKQASAQQRLDQLLQEASGTGRAKFSSNEIGSGGTSNTRIETEFQIVKGLNPAAAKLWDDMEAAARQCDHVQDAAGAKALRGSIGELLNDARNWTAQDLSVGTQSMAEQVLRPFLVVPVVGRRATGSGQSAHVTSRLSQS